VSQLPLFLLHTVLFPEGRLALRVFEKRYVDMVTACLKSTSSFGVCLIKQGDEVGRAAEPHDVGTLADIVACDLVQAGILQISVRGRKRFRVASTQVREDQLVFAEVHYLPEHHVALSGRHRGLSVTLRQALEQAGSASHFPPPQWEHAGWVGGLLAELLPLPLGLKQALLEMDDAAARLDVLARFCSGATAAT
jgi:uncharacterized protein